MLCEVIKGVKNRAGNHPPGSIIDVPAEMLTELVDFVRPVGSGPHAPQDRSRETTPPPDAGRTETKASTVPGQHKAAPVDGSPKCFACGGREWWKSVHGVTVCRRCHPPAPRAELGKSKEGVLQIEKKPL